MSAPLTVIKTLHDWNIWRASLSFEASLGFVPTMGALHDGHRSLIERSVRENAKTVVSVFVNPTQFDERADLEAYPRTFEADRALVASLGADVLFFPAERELYPNGYVYKVAETELSQRFCGAHRPGHFNGVLTIVMKLFGIVRPTRAYFGEKDFQQLELVDGMVREFFLPIEIVRCPTIRESSGLALSSRNTRLSASNREKATQFSLLLRSDLTDFDTRTELKRMGFRVDYVETFRGRRLGAVRIGDVRLIDNVLLERRSDRVQ